ncbi:hypothetical protein ACH5RR_030990 [Cinchona calisaya]|uniref:Uncharacterized protein n=1 Tax=Cinchona calisaya TaxID=153742 RepID=A0ABD2YJ76_9GENT
MKKTFYHNFMPSKEEEEEEASKATNTRLQTTRVLVEINDVHPPPILDYNNPWNIKKKLIQYEVVARKFVISFTNTFDHIFRYWTLAMANHVVLGHRMSVVLWDATDEKNPKKYCGDTVYFEILPNDDYVLACMDLFKDHSLNVDDEIGLYWDLRSSSFQFKLFLKAIQ